MIANEDVFRPRHEKPGAAMRNVVASPCPGSIVDEDMARTTRRPPRRPVAADAAVAHAERATVLHEDVGARLACGSKDGRSPAFVMDPPCVAWEASHARSALI